MYQAQTLSRSHIGLDLYEIGDGHVMLFEQP